VAGNCTDVVMVTSAVESDGGRACQIFFQGASRNALVIIRLAHSIDIVHICSEFEHEDIAELKGCGFNPVAVELGIGGGNSPSCASAHGVGRCGHALQNGKSKACP